MATYYPTSTNTKEVAPTLYSRDPSHVLYNEATLPGNMMYMNYLSSGSYSSDNLAPNSQPQQNVVELSVPNNILLQGSSMGESDFIASRLGVQGYNNAWRDGRNELPFMQTLDESMDNTDGLARNSISESPQMGRGMQMGVLNGQNLSLQQSNSSAVQGQGLSLSLGTQIPTSSLLYQPSMPNMSVMSSHQTTSGNIEPVGDDSSREKKVHAYPSPYGVSTLASTIPNSKYLKAAQQVLDEVVNVRKSLKGKLEKSQSMHNSAGNSSKENEEGSKSEEAAANNNESTAELSPTERQDLQNKLTKLLAMLDEVDRRYKQYYHQMQIVVSSFDMIAGSGAAKPYTALALQTISRHFRCLRDAINSQIQAARKSLGEQDGSNKEGGISRLRYIDQHLRQQRAFQQFGMMQQHAWRPQRGLPENSVTILRAWLFEHFLHPYPKDSDKIMLARQTGLTRSQVSNWFINARVRLWKPMVEEMYKEEIGDAEMDSNSLSENPPKGREENGQSEDKEDNQSMKSAAGKSQSSQFDDNPKSSLVPEMETINAPPSGFEGNCYMNLKTSGTSANTVDDSHLLQDALSQHDGSGNFMSYPMAELSRYGATGVSLTLGLQHCEGGLPVPDGQNSFMGMRGDEFNPTPPLGDDTTEYNYINMAANRHRFGPSQLLHDFVA